MASAATGILRSRFLQSALLAAGCGGSVYGFYHTAEMKSEKSQKSQKCAEKKACGVDAAVLKQIDEAFAKLNGPEGAKCHSLLKKHLTKETIEKLKNKKTKLGATLYDCI
uniref:Phosphagen kinase N-terminal domain-containing protein n=1 Tax=Panagrolaimus sp. ES5 TaxID=591445 RepID=A0AC34FIK6_9BILA